MHDIRFHRECAAICTPREGHRTIAVCGKGGVGKTAFAALLVTELARHPEAGNVLAIDADPALGLGLALGIQPENTIGHLRERVISTAQQGDEAAERAIAENLDMLVFDAVQESDEGFSFLAMGRSNALGCYCSVNDILRDAVSMLAERFDTIVIDGEAGLEQLNRQVLQRVDHLLLVSDGSARAANTVRLLSEIATRENIASEDDIYIVFNRSELPERNLVKQAHELGLPVLGCVPYDEVLIAADATGAPLSVLSSETPAAHEVSHIVADLLGIACEHDHHD